MLGLAFTEPQRFPQPVVENGEDLQEPGKPLSAGRKRRLRRKRNKLRAKSLIPPIPTAKFPSRAEKHVARDLYLALRCSWADVHRKRLHRVLLVNWEGDCVMDELLNQENFAQVRSKILRLVEGKVLVGHGLDACLYSLQIRHPWANLRDGSSYLPFMREAVDPLGVMVLPRCLSDLTGDILGWILPNEASSPYLLQLEAKACMDLYRSVRFDWENEITKLIQQKQRQREVVLEPREVPLASISENMIPCSEEGLLTEEGLAGLAGKAAPPITHHKYGNNWNKISEDAAEDHSTQAPTEIASVQSEEDVALSVDDSSVKTKTSDHDIWMPQDAVSEGGSKGPCGLWLPRPEQERLTEPEDCPNEENTVNPEDCGKQEEEECGEQDDGFGHLPSRLLNDSSSDDSDDEVSLEVPAREESSHFVEGTDWLEPDPPRSRSKDGWRSLRRRSTSPNKNSQQLATIQEDNQPRSRGERGHNRSFHLGGGENDWLAEQEEPSPKFSFFRKRPSLGEEGFQKFEEDEARACDDDLGPYESHNVPVEDRADAGVPPTRFLLFRRKSIEEKTAC